MNPNLSKENTDKPSLGSSTRCNNMHAPCSQLQLWQISIPYYGTMASKLELNFQVATIQTSRLGVLQAVGGVGRG